MKFASILWTVRSIADLQAVTSSGKTGERYTKRTQKGPGSNFATWVPEGQLP